MIAPTRFARHLAALDPCYVLTRGANRSPVHVRHPDIDRLAICGRQVDIGPQPPTSASIGCHDCRQMLAVIRDREARGLPRLCLAWSRPWGPGRSREQVRCHQPVEGHRLRPDLDYAWPWHDGIDLPDVEDDD